MNSTRHCPIWLFLLTIFLLLLSGFVGTKPAVTFSFTSIQKIQKMKFRFIAFQNNQFLFERITCEYNKDAPLSFASCDFKRISRTNARFQFQANLTERVNSAWGHVVVYKQYSSNVWRKFVIDLWENLCGWFNGTAKSWVLDVSLRFVLRHSNTKTNINRTCPLHVGYYYIKNDNMSLDIFKTEQLLPSGRYRADISGHKTKNSPWLVRATLYVSVSDHRVEVFWTATANSLNCFWNFRADAFV